MPPLILYFINTEDMVSLLASTLNKFTTVLFINVFAFQLKVIFSCCIYLGDNCIQNFHLGRYIFGYTVGNLVLRRRVSRAIKCDFRTYIQRYTSPNENFEYGYPHSNAQVTFLFKNDCENVVCWANIQRMSAAFNCPPAAYIHFSANEKRGYAMTSSLRQYIAGYTVANL